jgi:hypothetical protein
MTDLTDIVTASESWKQKPRKEDRKRGGVDTSELAIPKNHFDRSAKFRDFVRGHSCLLAGWRNEECGGVTEFAHITTGGLQTKGSDYFGVHLCSQHHRTGRGSYHKLGSVEAFDSVHGTDLWRVNAELLAEYIRRIAK